MRTAVVTLSISTDPRNASWLAAGLPSKQAYARAIGADFINIAEPKLGGSVASEKYQIGDLLHRYDRVFYLDADLFIRPDAPNIFTVVPPDYLGIFDESTYRAPDGTRRPREALLAWLREGWPDDPCEFYCNNGVFVCSREHRWLFDHAGLNRKISTYEQTCMSRKIWESLRCQNPPRLKVHWLTMSWNFMPRTWVGNTVSPATGWVKEAPPEPLYVCHYPCHSPTERATALEALNRKYLM